MAISKLRIILLAVSVFAVLGLSQIVLESHADARAGGGSSGGFRGSRSYQSPTRPAQPSQPRREATPPPQQPAPLAPQPGGFMRGLGTAILGGFLGSMLFSGIANAGGLGGLGGSGFGMMEVLLLGGLGYFHSAQCNIRIANRTRNILRRAHRPQKRRWQTIRSTIDR